MMLQTLRLNFKVIVTFVTILITRVSSRCPFALSVEDNNEITENGKFHLKSQDSQYLTGTYFSFQKCELNYFMYLTELRWSNNRG